MSKKKKDFTDGSQNPRFIFDFIWLQFGSPYRFGVKLIWAERSVNNKAPAKEEKENNSAHYIVKHRSKFSHIIQDCCELLQVQVELLLLEQQDYLQALHFHATFE